MKKYKIVVLSDLNNTTNEILKSAISLAKIIDGEIALFTVKKPQNLNDEANPLSAMRSINSEHVFLSKKIKSIISPLAKEHKVAINYSFALGNIKNEIENFIKTNRPDILVLGKRKSKPFDFISNDITKSVLNKFNGPVMIVNDKNALEPNKEISLGALNSLQPALSFEFAPNLIAQTQKPMKSFSIFEKASSEEVANVMESEKPIEYVFENNDNVVNNLSNYLSKSNIDLLLVKRENQSVDKQTNYKTPNIKKFISKLDVTLLVAGV